MVQNTCLKDVLLVLKFVKLFKKISLNCHLSTSRRAKKICPGLVLHFEKAELDCLGVYSLGVSFPTIKNEENIPEQEFLSQENLRSINLFFSQGQEFIA